MSDVLGPGVVDRFHVSTGDGDEIAETLGSVYVPHSPRLAVPARAWYEHASASLPGLGADRVQARMSYATSTRPLEFPVAVVLLGGVLRTRMGAEDASLSPGDVWLYRPGLTIDVEWQNLQAITIRNTLDDVVAAAREVGDERVDRVEFRSLHPVSESMGRYWREVALLASRQLLAEDPAAGYPLVAAQVRQLVAAAMVAVFPNSATTTGYVPGPGYAAPASVRRAVAFIDANCDRPIALSDIAAAAGTGPRALQNAFARHQDTSPMGYLRQARLERAHRALQAADPTRGDTVAAIALRWGFANPGRFAVEYRTAYGHSPSQTLRG